jgi:hypothetical protein
MPIRTTVRLDDGLVRRAKQAAARRHITFTALVEEGLQLALAQRKDAKRDRFSLPVSQETGGTLPGIDLDDTSALLDLMERGS